MVCSRWRWCVIATRLGSRFSAEGAIGRTAEPNHRWQPSEEGSAVITPEAMTAEICHGYAADRLPGVNR